MPKIDLDEFKKSKKKKPWASMDELLSHGNTNNGNEKNAISTQKNKSDTFTKQDGPLEHELDKIHLSDSKIVNLKIDTIPENKEKILAIHKIDSAPPLKTNPDLSNTLEDNKNKVSLNEPNSLSDPISVHTIESSSNHKNKTSIESVCRLNTESIENLYRDNNNSIDILYRNSIETSFKNSSKESVYIDSINKSIYKSIQTKANDPTLELAIMPQNQTLSSILKVGSKQFVILLYLFKTTTETGTHLTKEVSANELAQIAKTSIGSARSAINELIDKNLVTRKIFSKAGWTVYEFSDHSYHLILKYTQNITDSGLYRFYTEMTIQNYIDLSPSKVVSNINTNLQTKNTELDQLTWPTINVSEINLNQIIKFGVTRKQIQDIFNQKLNFTTSTLQDFVDRFSIYASEPKNIKNINSIQAVFVKMAQLASKGQDPLVDIETDADRIIRERIESLKAIQEMRLKQESELITLEFENWYICLSSVQRDEASPPSAVSKSGSSTQKLILKNYFIENIWPEKRAELYGSKQAILNPNENRNQPEV
jgi:predicted transcriptional regulator